MTLRRRLVAVQVLLVTVGLGVFGVVSYSLYSRSQYQRVDSRLQSAAPLLSRLVTDQVLGDGTGPGPRPNRPTGRGAPENLPPGSYVQLRSATGRVLGHHQIPCYGSTCPQPAIPAGVSAGSKPGGHLLTVASTGGSGSFRVLVRPDSFPGDAQPPSDTGAGPPGTPTGDLVITAIPLGDVTRSLHRLVIVDLAVGAGVLVALSAAGLLVVRRGLRPLVRMGATARAIAGGDLSRRAAPADERSEVGQLGAAFNAMMGNIEDAFGERDATEERLRQFLADASHELRTPLTSIRGYAELYRIGAAAGPEDLETVMGRIEQHAIEMGGLVEELLLLARLDETRPPERVEVDLSILAAECCHDTAVTVPHRRLTLEAPGPVVVVGDPTHLRQALTNLLANARRHTPDLTPIDVAVTGGGGVAVVAVRDHGPGLGPEGLARVFDRFWRADRSRVGAGSGLGLAIVAAVAAEHGGRAEVANATGGGAVFRIRLPMPPAAAALPLVPVGTALAAPEQSQGGPMPSPGRSEEHPAH